uniref:Uncharacterized protein n=1 Tax=Xiphophorus couchianus TaxID=32473 RepID=A0A3B5M464_9TELE
MLVILFKFPDLNSIEHLWVQFGCAICARVTNRTTLADLQQMLIEEWDTIQQQNMTKRVINVRERCQAVVVYCSSFHQVLTNCCCCCLFGGL